MNIKGMIQKAKEKLFGKKQEEPRALHPEYSGLYKNATYGAESTEVMSEEEIRDGETMYRFGDMEKLAENANAATESIRKLNAALSASLCASAETMRVQVEGVFQRFHEMYVRPVSEILMELMYRDEPWKLEKMKMPNNERRRRKIPMVRSRAYIQARKNSRKRKKKKG